MEKDGRWELDWADFEDKLAAGGPLPPVQPPQPPGHRVDAGGAAPHGGAVHQAHVLVLVSDEIHSDLIFHGKKHIPTATLSPTRSPANVITGISGTKTFNLAGLQATTVVFPNAHMKKVFDQFWMNMDIHRNNAFSLTAMEAAFNHGEEWLEQLLPYLSANFDYVADYCGSTFPQIKTCAPDATYLMWLDCRALGLDNDALRTLHDREGGPGPQRRLLLRPQPERLHASQRRLPPQRAGAGDEAARSGGQGPLSPHRTGKRR